MVIGNLALETADRSYPLVVHIPHSLISTAFYRQWREKEGVPAQWLYDMVVPLFTHSQGGGIGTKAILDGAFPLHYLASRWDYMWVQVLSYIANYWSPYDIVNRMLVTPRNPLRLFCLTMDATDALASLCGLIDYSRKQFPDNKVLPTIIGIVMFNTGSFCRMLDARSRGKEQKSFLAAPGHHSGVTQAIVWSALYQFFGHAFQKGKHRDQVVKLLTFLFVINTLVDDVFDIDAFANVQKPVAALLGALRRTLRLGPQKDAAKARSGKEKPRKKG